MLGAGWDSTAYRIPDRGGDRVVRIPRQGSPGRLSGYLERELRLLPDLQRWGLPTPRDARAVHDTEGRLLAAIHRLIEGVGARRGLVRGRRRERLARQLGEFFTRLHAFPRERAETLGVGELDLWQDQYRELVEFCRPLLGPRTAAWLDATTARFLGEGGTDGAPRVLIHGDIAPQHLLLGGGGALAGVIDFGDAMVADPALDFAGLLNEFRWPFVEQALAHYGGEVDPHLRRRARFYIEVAPLFSVRYGDLVRGGQERVDGLRRLAARAAAATRHAGRDP